jgi:hypothetical protein
MIYLSAKDLELKIDSAPLYRLALAMLLMCSPATEGSALPMQDRAASENAVQPQGSRSQNATLNGRSVSHARKSAGNAE